MTIDDSTATSKLADGYASLPTATSIPEGINGIKNASYPSPIAICSMAFRLPGGITTEAAFWDVLVNGKDMRVPIPASRFKQSSFDDGLGDPSGMKATHGYFLDDDLTGLDVSMFPTIMPGEAGYLDPQLRHLVEVTRECLESAGETDYRGKRIACYVGAFSEEWAHSIRLDTQNHHAYAVTSVMDLFLANRVSHTFDFKGPSMVIKTGCSASATALHEACRSVQSGDSEAAIVGGVNFLNGPMLYSILGAGVGVLSPEGSSKSFDASANGYARGEAVNVVYLKRLEDAIRDKNPVRAIIRNIGSNSDGAGGGVLAPDSASHEALIRQTYQQAGLNPTDTPFVECHATGTQSGDPVEATAVGRVFRDKGVYIGSIKPNFGHSEAASGLSSLIKAILCLKHDTIAPNIKFTTPNKDIPFEEYRLTVPTAPLPWPKNAPRRVSVNSFGIGGSNVHIILEAYQDQELIGGPASRDQELLLFSGNTPTAVSKVAESMLEYYSTHPDAGTNLAYTLAYRRERLHTRSFAVVSRQKGKDAKASPLIKASERAPKVVMVFTGQGAQWPMMGKELLSLESFRQDLTEMDMILQQCNNPPSWSIIEELSKPAETARVYEAEISQPLCTVIQIGLVNALRRSGLSPHAVVGHSSGEIAAAYASGALTQKEAIIIAYYRGYVSSKRPETPVGMAAIAIGANEASRFLTQDCDVVVAATNSPQSTTISGDLDGLRKVIANINRDLPNVMTRELKVDMAYHSHHMEPLAAIYEQHLLSETGLCHGQPSCKFYSTVKGNRFGDSFSPTYWTDNLLSQVKFSEAVQKLLSDEAKNKLLFLEIGPHSQLSGPLRQICTHKDVPFEYSPTLVRGENCTESLLSTFGRLFQYGIDVDLTTVIPNMRAPPLIDLPLYPWNHESRYSEESLQAKATRFKAYPRHSLLGDRIAGTTAMEPVWRSLFGNSTFPWLQDHKLHNSIVFPFAGYISMAGEAIRQLSNGGQISGYKAKHVCVFNPLVFADNRLITVVTALKPHRLSDLVDSEYFEFSISSNADSGDATQWKKHCSGLVAACEVRPEPSLLASTGTDDEVQQFPRRIDHRRWYETVGRAGFGFGPEFTTLSNIEFATVTKDARAELSNSKSRKEFMVDPTTIDGCLQLMACLQTGGHLHSIEETYLPTVLEEIHVFPSDAKVLHARAWSTESVYDGNLVEATAEGQTILRLKDLRVTKVANVSNSATHGQGPYGAARLEWVPDFELTDPTTLVDPPRTNLDSILEALVLFILDADDRLQGLQEAPAEAHLVKYKDWIHKKRVEGPTSMYADTFEEMGKLSQAQRLVALQECLAMHAKDTEISPLSDATKVIWENIEKLYSGETNALELFGTDLLWRLYESVNWQIPRMIRQLANAKPGLRVLEVGGGTGSATTQILNEIIRPGGNPPYGKYVFSDISSAFSATAKERLHDMPNMEFKTLDISQSPLNQGFEGEMGSFDVVLAFYVVHATPRIKDSLENLRSLLRPDGHLILVETMPGVLDIGHIFGLLPGWWVAEDGREWGPAITVAQWDNELQASGFSGIEWSSTCGVLEPRTAIISARPATAAELLSPKLGTVTIVSLDPRNDVPQTLLASLANDGIDVEMKVFGEKMEGKKSLIISTIGIESESFDLVMHMEKLQEFFKAQGQTKVLWLLHPTQFQGTKPGVNSAELLAVIKCTNREMGLNGYTLQIGRDEKQFFELTKNVMLKVGREVEKRGIINRDYDFVVQSGVLKLGRFEPFSLEREIEEQAKQDDAERLTDALVIKAPGKLNTLGWVKKPFNITELPNGIKVGIKLKAFCLNFRDLMLAMGILPLPIPLGSDGAGIVRSVGKDVKDIAVGDRVAYFILDGARNLDITGSPFCFKIPDDMSFQEACTVPTVYMTALYSLVDVARVTRGQTVLIHSAAGGFGHAAVSICRHLGAEIFVTVGTEDKAKYLMDKFHIPRNRIFNSRNDSFVEGILRETNGQGVDVVLNSLSGNLLHASWECVSEFGYMVELGKRDLMESSKLAMKPFLQNRTYTCVDLGHLGKKRPFVLASLFQRSMEIYTSMEKSMREIPYNDYPAVQLEQGFRSLQQGTHIGKVVYTMPEDASLLQSSAPSTQLTFDPNGSYLLTGGLGGIGRSIVRWMVQRGARSFIFFSPSASSETHEWFVKELESFKCNVTRISGMTQELADIKKAVAAAQNPIKGVFHLAMKLQDQTFIKMTPESWNAVKGPKADGLYNLHTALMDLNQSPDFLIVSTSISTIINTPGQSNYVAANMLMESFCQYRRSQGLPALALAICAIADVGYVSERQEVKELHNRFQSCLYEKELLKFIEHGIVNQRRLDSDVQQQPCDSHIWKDEGTVYMGLITPEVSLADPACMALWRGDAHMASYHNYDVSQSKASTNSQWGKVSEKMRKLLEAARRDPAILKDDETITQFAVVIGESLFTFMMRDVEDIEDRLDDNFRQMGLDSLVLMELRGWFREVLQIDISPLDLASKSTLKELGQCATELLYKRYFSAQ